MHRTSPLAVRRAALPLAALLVAACGGGGGDATAPAPVPPPRPANEVTASGGTVAALAGAVRLTFPAGAVSTGTTVTVRSVVDPVGSEHVVAGHVYDFGPDGTQFAQPVRLELAYAASALPPGSPASSLRVAKLIGDAWVPVAEGAAVDSASGKVVASIRSFSSYAVVRDPCVPSTLPMGATSGRIGRDDCVFTGAGRRSDYYELWAPTGQMITVATTGPLQGLVGIKEATADPNAGTVWVSGSLGGTLRLVSSGSRLQLFVSGQDSTRFGDYTVTRGETAPSHACSTDTYLMPGATVRQTLTSANSCRYLIKYPAVPAAMNKPIDAHYYGVKLRARLTYIFTLSGLTSTFSPTLTVFSGNAVVAQSGVGAPGTRSVHVTPAADGWYVVEVSAGWFVDPPAMTQWEIPSGSYTLSVSG